MAIQATGPFDRTNHARLSSSVSSALPWSFLVQCRTIEYTEMETTARLILMHYKSLALYRSVAPHP